MLSRDKNIEIFCIADDFCKEFDSNMKEMTLKADGKKPRSHKCKRPLKEGTPCKGVPSK